MEARGAWGTGTVKGAGDDREGGLRDTGTLGNSQARGRGGTHPRWSGVAVS